MLLPGGPGQEGCRRQTLQQQFAPGREALVGAAGEAAPVVDAADRQIAEADRRHRQQAVIAGGHQAADDQARRNDQQAPHGGGASLAKVGLGALLPDHLPQFERPQARHSPAHQGTTHQGTNQQGQAELEGLAEPVAETTTDQEDQGQEGRDPAAIPRQSDQELGERQGDWDDSAQSSSSLDCYPGEKQLSRGKAAIPRKDSHPAKRAMTVRWLLGNGFPAMGLADPQPWA